MSLLHEKPIKIKVTEVTAVVYLHSRSEGQNNDGAKKQ